MLEYGGHVAKVPLVSDLFTHAEPAEAPASPVDPNAPLAQRMRPRTLDEYI
jgi:hypothetical protein